MTGRRRSSAALVPQSKRGLSRVDLGERETNSEDRGVPADCSGRAYPEHWQNATGVRHHRGVATGVLACRENYANWAWCLRAKWRALRLRAYGARGGVGLGG